MARWAAAGSLAVCVAVSLLTGSCSSQSKSREVSSTVTLAQAEKLVRAWAKEPYLPGGKREHQEFKEVTTPEVRNRLHAQVFVLKYRETPDLAIQAYLIKDRKPYLMSHSFGGNALDQMCVCDIDGDSREDLLYAHSDGSGIHYSMVEGYSFAGPTPSRIGTGFDVLFADIVPKKTNGKTVDLFAVRGLRRRENDMPRLGQLIVANSGDRKYLDLKAAPNLPKEWQERIRRFRHLAPGERPVLRKSAPPGKK